MDISRKHQQKPGEEVPSGGNSNCKGLAWQQNSKECGWVASEGEGGGLVHATPSWLHSNSDLTDGKGNPGGF